MHEIAPRHLKPRSPSFLPAALLAALAVPSCKSLEPTGTYTLVSVDGRPLPCPIRHEGSPTMKEGRLVFTSPDVCTSRTVFTVPRREGDIVREVTATWTREGDMLTMRWEGMGTTTGTLSGASFVMDNEGILFEYRK